MPMSLIFLKPVHYWNNKGVGQTFTNKSKMSRNVTKDRILGMIENCLNLRKHSADFL